MRLRRYCRGIAALVDSHPLIASHSLTIDERPTDVAVVKGALVFVDGSELHFMEFLADDGEVVKEKYSYHYMKSNRMIFRYDNALDPKARSLSTYPHHKHEGKRMLPSKAPTLKVVLEEVQSCLGQAS